MNDVRKYKASIFRKTFNITSLVLNVFHFGLALFYFGMVFVLALLAGFIVLLFEGSMEEFLWPLVWTTVYLLPALVIFIFSIISTVKCFRYGYKKSFEMATYIMSILFNIIDIVIVLVNVKFFEEFAVISFIFSFISIILFIVAIIACAIDKRK
ncbi:MAG: hypothetical protein ACI4WW_05540 [Candidatus Coprovivens sp.]